MKAVTALAACAALAVMAILLVAGLFESACRGFKRFGGDDE